MSRIASVKVILIIGLSLILVALMVIALALFDVLDSAEESPPAEVAVASAEEASAEVEEDTTEETVQSQTVPKRPSGIVFQSFSETPRRNAIGVLEMLWMVQNSRSNQPMQAVEVEYCVWNVFGEPAQHRETGESCAELVYQPNQALRPGENDFVTFRFPGFESVGRVNVTVLRVVFVGGNVWIR